MHVPVVASRLPGDPILLSCLLRIAITPNVHIGFYHGSVIYTSSFAAESHNMVQQAVREAATICPAPLTLKVVSESRVTWATSVPILVFLRLSVLDLGLMYETDVRQTSHVHHRLMPLP